ncbi:hypothetical protein LR48_Vigan08g006800 [Vigna angularis]|uniref:Uncharacterized protein n=1 Tax=Phaseolus angularis TaxID=3914 RepID=A0A0L9V2R7_PHAAN|nr:hypothetical protein LR48_Vigan08g006800 [Vigna angularis]
MVEPESACPSPRPSDPTLVTVAPPTSNVKGKRKSSKENFVSSHKRSKGSSPEGPLLIGTLDPNVQVANCTQFNLSPKEKTFFKGMTAKVATDMDYELRIRSNICMAYTIGTPKGIVSTEELQVVQQDLEAALKANEELDQYLEETQKTNEENRKKAMTALTEARIVQCSYFFNVLIDHEGYDVMKMVVDGQLIDLPLPPVEADEDLPTVPEEPQRIEVVVEDVEEEGDDEDE